MMTAPTSAFPQWDGLTVVVVGLDRAGLASADALIERGATVTVIDAAASDVSRDRAKLLAVLGAEVVAGDPDASLPACDLVVATAWNPAAAVYRQAHDQGIPVWSELQLAHQLAPDESARWLGVTGPGSTEAVAALAAILRAGGLTATSAGGDGRPIIEVLLDGVAYDGVALDLSGQQLHWSDGLGLAAAAVLGTAPVPPWYDQPAWAGDAAAAYRADLGRIFDQAVTACLYNVADPATEQLVEQADVVEGARAIGLTTGIPAVSMLGVVDDLLVDRAFVAQRQSSALELVAAGDLGLGEPTPERLMARLAAAGLARAFGLPARAVRDGLRRQPVDPATNLGVES